MSRILVTGGAGFIGSHLVDALIGQGHEVWVLDSLEKQVHPTESWPDYLNPAAHRIGYVEDGRLNGARVSEAVRSRVIPLQSPFDCVYHLAALVGVGQSQYEIERYIYWNTGDTGRLIQFWADNPELRPGRLIVASSMSIYGEGNRHSGISEDVTLNPPNVYAQTKLDQEKYCLFYGEVANVPACALRFFNVVGERQALSNPYTGIAAIFASCLLSGRGGLVYEDGQQVRDFVHVSDIVQALLLAMNAPEEKIATEVFNVGTGKPTTLLELHGVLAECLGVKHEPIITGWKRKGDIRFCYADITKIRTALGYEPRMDLCDAMAQYSAWLKTQDTRQILLGVDKAAAELKAKRLLS